MKQNSYSGAVSNLQNVGNTCYLNSVLQAIYSCISEYESFNPTNEVENNFLGILNKTFTISEFVDFLEFKMGTKNLRQQSDAMAFLTDFFALVNPNGLFKDFFRTKFSKCGICECGDKITIPLKTNIACFYLKEFPDNTIQTAFNRTLSNNLTPYNCAKCGITNGNARELYSFEANNIVLVVAWPHEVGQFKLAEELTCETNNSTYILKSVVLHRGSTHGGHYIALVNQNYQWYICNDSIVREITYNEFSRLIGSWTIKMAVYTIKYSNTPHYSKFESNELIKENEFLKSQLSNLEAELSKAKETIELLKQKKK